MAAVTADTLTLPRVTGAALGDTERPVLAISTAPAGFEGEGFPVRRTMAGIAYQYLDPFIMMDHMGEVDYAAGEPKGTNWHPHRGFETVTYLIDGQFIHQDTHGGGGVITEGATQWMTAGAGLLHIETPPEKLVEDGGLFHGFQLWVNLPAKDKFLAPKYQPDRGRQTSCCWPAPTAARCCASSPARSTVTSAPVRRTPRSRCCTPRSRPVPSCRCRGSRPTTRWPTSTPVPARSGRRASRSTPGSSPCSAPATGSPSPPTPSRTAGPARWRSSCSAASRSTSRWCTTARS